ncbi:hypothetical protein GCM10010124_28900 [Pilimelia terevasa]|uniref:Sensor-like histidine kinase SenX3 n=1 Tax=Pilimelia terevasa TaxID=53372 RepID=A0A8J3BRX0_9ACTN|nr:PAS domain S-box protein [Pilimelia terevasa]GGK34498.1 hypothetical protein GCM10010124_28900 [Pilimelia terevasa]
MTSGEHEADVQARVTDPARLRTLRASGLLEAGALPSLDRLSGLAARVLGAPTALVSLVDAAHQVFASGCGLPAPVAPGSRVGLSHSFCRYVVAADAPVLVSDARGDARLAGSPAVRDLGVVAYAGVPLRAADGTVLGAFCVVDHAPRRWTDDEVATLSDLAAAARSELALRCANGELRLAADRMRAVLDSAQDAFVSMDSDGRFTAWNAAAARLFGWGAAEAVGRTASELIIPERFRAAHEQGLARVRDTGQSPLPGQRLALTAVDRAGREFPVEMTLQVSLERDRPVFHAFLHDITARHAAARELDRERQRLEDERSFLRALLDSLDAGVAACDSDGRLALFNHRLREVHGADAQAVDAGNWSGTYALYAADARTPLAAEEIPLARAFAGEVVVGQEMVVRPPGAPPRRFLANGRPIDTADGRRLGAVVAMHDITGAHRAETLRRARHAVAQALSEAVRADEAGAAALAAVGTELGWVSGAYWQVAGGRALARVSGWSAFGAAPEAAPGDARLPGLVWWRAAEIWTGDLPRPPRAATDPPGGAIGLPVRSGDRVLGVLVFHTGADARPEDDVLAVLREVCAHVGRFVERRHAEDLTLALAAARRDFDRVVEQVNDYLWTVEIRPGGEVRSVYASPNGTGVFGAVLPTDTDMAAVLAERMHPGDRAAFAAFHATVARGASAEIECRVRGYDDVTRWVWTRAVPRREDGALFVDGICTNITERRQLAEQRERLLEREREQVRQLREVDRLKDELVAVVSHELRNPVTSIRGYAEMLLDDPELPATPRHFAEVIDRKSSHLHHLVEDLLTLARLDAGSIEIDPRPLSAARLIREAVQEQGPAAQAKNLTVAVATGRLSPVHGDPTRLRQVLDNLISNAVKYTPEGGTVRVVAADAEAGVVVTVTDTGIGIPADQYGQLFQRFFRARTAVAAGITGTGLGLAITKAVVEAHGGTIAAAPAPGGGTAFTVSLPAVGAPHAAV